MPGVNLPEAGGEQAVEIGHHLEQAALDHLESLADLVDHLGALGADRFGEPEDLDVLADGIAGGLSLFGQ